MYYSVVFINVLLNITHVWYFFAISEQDVERDLTYCYNVFTFLSTDWSVPASLITSTFPEPGTETTTLLEFPSAKHRVARADDSRLFRRSLRSSAPGALGGALP